MKKITTAILTAFLLISMTIMAGAASYVNAPDPFPTDPPASNLPANPTADYTISPEVDNPLISAVAPNGTALTKEQLTTALTGKTGNVTVQTAVTNLTYSFPVAQAGSLNGSLYLGAETTGLVVDAVKGYFETNFSSNTFEVISLYQKGAWGTPVSVTAPVTIRAQVYVYILEYFEGAKATYSLNVMNESTQVPFDVVDGKVTFETPVAGEIVFSTQPLALKGDIDNPPSPELPPDPGDGDGDLLG